MASHPVFNIEVFNTCQMPFWQSKKPFFLWALHKNVLCKVPLVIVKASPCHKIHWLQVANKTIVGLQSWHSSKHFQIPTTLATSAWQAQLYMNVWVKSDCRSRLKLATLDVLMRVSLCSLPMENMDWARIFDSQHFTKTGGLCLWSWMMIECNMQGI